RGTLSLVRYVSAVRPWPWDEAFETLDEEGAVHQKRPSALHGKPLVFRSWRVGLCSARRAIDCVLLGSANVIRKLEQIPGQPHTIKQSGRDLVAESGRTSRLPERGFRKQGLHTYDLSAGPPASHSCADHTRCCDQRPARLPDRAPGCAAKVEAEIRGS